MHTCICACFVLHQIVCLVVDMMFWIRSSAPFTVIAASPKFTQTALAGR